MNQLLSLLLLSTAATRGMQKSRYEHTSTHTHPKTALLTRQVVSSTPVQSVSYKSTHSSAVRREEEINPSRLLTALNAADEATQMSPAATGPFTLPPLDYDYNGLEPYIDEATLRVHHNGHHKAYVDRLNAALSRYPETYQLTLNEMLLFPDRLPGDIYTQVTNNAGGHYNHSLMWKILSPQAPSQPSGELAKVITEQFGSFDNFKKAFAAAAESVFGSGYAYLILNPYGRLLIVTTSNQTTPVPLRAIPLIPLDMWEHAYYLKHQNKRRDYINDYFNLINWDQVGKRYEAANDVLTAPDQI